MSPFSHTRRTPAVDPTPDNAEPDAGSITDSAELVSKRVPRTRTGTAWVGVCVAAGIAIALLIFMVQNTRRVEISFLWMNTSTSLALTLLIAAVGGVLLTLIVGTARIVQLRRLVRRLHH